MKLFNDTLKNNGRWSRKSITMLVSFIMACLTGIYIVVSDYILEDKEINRWSVDVFNGFILLVAGLAGITVADKFTPRNKDGHRQDEEVG
jgi:hypothetical protein